MIAWFYLILMLILTNISQVLLKRSVEQMNFKSFSLKEVKYNVLIESVLGIVFLLVAPFLYILALKDLPLNIAFSFTSINVIIVQFTGYKYFNEKITSNKLLGAGLIVLGLVIYNI